MDRRTGRARPTKEAKLLYRVKLIIDGPSGFDAQIQRTETLYLRSPEPLLEWWTYAIKTWKEGGTFEYDPAHRNIHQSD